MMGWDVYPLGMTKQAVLEDLDRAGKDWTLLASKLVGKVYWQVFEIAKEGGKKRRAIFCAVIEKPNKEDGYATKVMDEAMEPYYYDCPLKFIDLAGPTDHVGANNWRRDVIEYHEKKKQIEKKARAAQPGTILSYGGHDYELISPHKRSNWIVRNISTGINYRMPNSAIREAIAEAAENEVRAEIENGIAKPKETMPDTYCAQGALFA